MRMIARAKSIFLAAFLAWTSSICANDSAAGIAGNGIYLKEEKNISLEGEDLYVSENKIVVSYVFKNNASADITTIVAFPIPEYDFDISGQTPYPTYDDFEVEVNGMTIRYQQEVKALVEGVDHTKLLSKLGVTVENFGKFGEGSYYGKETYFNKLTTAEREILLRNKLVVMDGPVPVPNWTVSKKYFWTQVFPSRTEVRVKHTYRPYKGYDYISSEKSFFEKACIGEPEKKWIKSIHGPKNYRYVDYVLTTANNWKQPIRSFHLVVDGVESEDRVLVSTCFPGVKRRIGNNRYEIALTDFVPNENLTVYFIRRSGP